MPTKEEYMGAEEVASFLGCTLNALNIMRHRGEGPPFIKINRRKVMYRKQAVFDWMNDREEDPERRRLA